MNKTISISDAVKKRLAKWKALGQSYTGLLTQMLDEYESKRKVKTEKKR